MAIVPSQTRPDTTGVTQSQIAPSLKSTSNLHLLHCPYFSCLSPLSSFSVIPSYPLACSKSSVVWSIIIRSVIIRSVIVWSAVVRSTVVRIALFGLQACLLFCLVASCRIPPLIRRYSSLTISKVELLARARFRHRDGDDTDCGTQVVRQP